MISSCSYFNINFPFCPVRPSQETHLFRTFTIILNSFPTVAEDLVHWCSMTSSAYISATGKAFSVIFFAKDYVFISQSNTSVLPHFCVLLSRKQTLKLDFIFKMASRKKQSIPLQQALDYVLDSDYDTDLDSSTGGMSSAEEEELDKQLTIASEINLE